MSNFLKIICYVGYAVLFAGFLTAGFYFYDLWRYPTVSLTMQPKSYNEGSSLFKTITRIADCNYHEIGVFVADQGVLHSYCDKDLKFNGVDIKLSATIDVYFNKEKLGDALKRKRGDSPVILIGEYYLITAFYYNANSVYSSRDSGGVLPTRAVDSEAYLQDFPRVAVYLHDE